VKSWHSHPWPRPRAEWDRLVGSGAPTCLTDEAAIDFPAVLRLVDAARRMFVEEGDGPAGSKGTGHPGGALTTTLQVSRRAAAIGTVSACVLTLRDICPSCGGRGESWSEPCLRCATAGQVVVRRRVRLAVPPGVVDGAVYRFRLSRANQSSVKVDVRIAVRPSCS
jgi:hypothetical protein